jgi:SnoaL-like domain
MTTPLTGDGMEGLIREYFEGCNEADVDKMVRCFVPGAVHYFPPGMYEGPFRGALTIAERWVQAVDTLGSVWTVDQVITDPPGARAVVEWTHFKSYRGQVLRGDEWYEFDRESGLISEIRAYYASPQDPSLGVLELGGYPYRERGYPSAPPIARTPPPG